MSPCLHHESMSLPRVHVYNQSPEFQIIEIQNTNYVKKKGEKNKLQNLSFQKYILHEYRNTNYRCTKIKITETQKFKLQKYRNQMKEMLITDITIYRSAEIQITG